MNDTNVVVTGSGTANDPYTYNFHETPQSGGPPWVLYAVVIEVGLAAVAGFLLGDYFGNRRKKSN
jgi:hypothetical protein